MKKSDISAFAKKNQIDRIERADDWNGYEIYVPVYDGECCVGLPYVIMVNGDVIRMSTPEESLQRIDDEYT